MAHRIEVRYKQDPRIGGRTGITAVMQPGGSLRDDEVIKAADDLGLAMLFTGIRHFRQ